MNEEQLSQVLERLAEKAVPEGSSIWDKLESAYQAESRPKRIPFALSRVAVFALIVGIGLFSAGGALAYILLSRFPADAGGQNVANAGLGVMLDETATVNGITIHLLQGFADEQRILLFYTLEGVDPTRFNHREPDAQLDEIYNFDGLDNYQTLDPLYYQYRLDEKRVLVVSSFRHEAAVGETVDFFWQVIVNNLGEVVPPEFHFNLSLPVQESMVIPVNQQIESGSFNLVLKEIQIGAASTTVMVCTVLPAGYDYADINDIGLNINGQLYVYVYGSEVNTIAGQERCMSQSFDVGVLTGSETIQVDVSGMFVAPLPTQAEVDAGVAALAEAGLVIEADLGNEHLQWEVISNPNELNPDAWIPSRLYQIQQVNIGHTFTINLSEIVLANQ